MPGLRASKKAAVGVRAEWVVGYGGDGVGVL